MPTPTLIQPASVVIEPLDRTNTKYDGRTRAPIKVLKRSTSVSFDAQVQYGPTERSSAQGGGLVKQTSGYLIARKVDLDALSYVPSMGDRIATIGGFWSSGWLHGKLLLVLGLSAMHGICASWVRAFAEDRNTRSSRFYRLINEIPAVALVFIVLLVVLKPF